ncbi:MAG: hypothetical protein KAQ92_01760 [Candidatus Aenigmarchaeota archaeon]|nr:hypothetical protein [Candidatus Aenigmarchaeota archaeon]
MKSIDTILNKAINYNKYGQIFCILLILFSITVLFFNYQNTGEFITKGIDFTGGSEAEIYLDKNILVSSDVILNLNEQFSLIDEDKEADVRFSTSATSNSIHITTKNPIETKEIISVLKDNNIEVTKENIQQNYISSGLSENFLKQAQKALLVALLAMALVIFISFRVLAPSLGIMLAAICDILFTVAIMSILEIKLTIASLTGLLMLIGYSVDTDVLLTTRLLKRRYEGTINSQILSSMKTGITMTLTTIVSLLVLYIFAGDTKIGEIAIVIMIGLVGDLPFTWFQNVGILKRYLKNKNKNKK